MPIIRTENLQKEYFNEGVGTPVLFGVNFTMEKGEFVAIMGPSGSGKSTLMHILGFLDKATSGLYEFEGQNTRNFDKDYLAKLRNERIGFVFQSFNLLSRTTVLDNVKLPLMYSNKTNHDDLAKKALADVGLSHRLDFYTNQISGGEKQRVAIARALVNDPAVIFADEPTGNLDSKSGNAVLSILQELNNKGHTIILVTHEMDTANHAKRIIRVKDGMIVGDELVKNRTFATADGELKK
ncbi:MAG: putative ABC transport system ATP-binding protein [Parcubacteria bacterium C7867-006]|nr:MAG: putative ABC transport system ATP-binding protein [Parcubacteria bacterium C7867-006]